MNVKLSVILCSIFIFGVLENLLPFFDYKGSWLKRVATNFSIGLMNAIATSFFTTYILKYIFTHPDKQALFNLIQPVWLGGILSLLVLDLYMYSWHRLMHTWALGWKFHRVHHTDKFMNISTAYRFHLIEVVASNLPKILLIFILGIKAELLLIYELVFAASLIFHHSNYHLSWKIDHFLSHAIITPNYHRVHHSMVLQESNSNYGSILSLWDRLFKTFRYRQNPQDIQLGLIEDQRNLNTWQLIALPWEKNYKNNKL